MIRGISDARDPEAAARAICRALAGAGTGISKPAQNTRAETTAQNAADVRELMRTRLSMTEAELDRMVRRRPFGTRATVEPKLAWLQKRFELDVYYTGLRDAERRANLKYEQQRINAMQEHKLFAPGTEDFLESRRKKLAAQIGDSLGHM